MNPRLVLTVEDLLWALEDSFEIAGFNGSCERVVSYKKLIRKLKILIDRPKTNDQS